MTSDRLDSARRKRVAVHRRTNSLPWRWRANFVRSLGIGEPFRIVGFAVWTPWVIVKVVWTPWVIVKVVVR